MSADVLLVTADGALATAVPRLCALAGLTCELQRDSNGARGGWRDATAVVVGSDVAPALAVAALPRRDQVIVLTTGVADAGCWQAALALGATTLIQLPDQEATLVDALRAGSVSPGKVARRIAVIGGCGGAGASTLAAALAITASASGATMLIDGDPLGGGLDVLVGAESVPGLRWNELARTRGRLDPEAFAAAVCDVHGIGLLSWGRQRPPCNLDPDAVETVLAAASAAFANVVIDIARFPCRVTQSLLEAAETSVVVVPADVRAVAATASSVAALGRWLRTPLLVVRDPGAGRLAAKDVAASLGLPLTATLRSEPAVQTAAHRGEAPTRRGRCAITQACEEILAATIGSGTP
jgi:secretion/DNA translocation related CpaE-like protein